MFSIQLMRQVPVTWDALIVLYFWSKIRSWLLTTESFLVWYRGKVRAKYVYLIRISLYFQGTKREEKRTNHSSNSIVLKYGNILLMMFCSWQWKWVTKIDIHVPSWRFLILFAKAIAFLMYSALANGSDPYKTSLLADGQIWLSILCLYFLGQMCSWNAAQMGYSEAGYG